MKYILLFILVSIFCKLDNPTWEENSYKPSTQIELASMENLGVS